MVGQTEGGPVGVRTFLIADVRGYTRFTQEQGDEAAAALAARFAELVRSAVSESGGDLIELRGDEALVAFASARQALLAAVELQRRSRESSEDSPALPLGLGIGLDSGEAVPTEGGYRGGALNLASRLCSVAGPGQVFASEGVIHLARHVPGLQFSDPRPVRVKGIAERVRAIEVLPDEPLPPLAGTDRDPRRGRLVVGGVLVAAGITAAVAAALVFVFTRGAEASSGIAANTASLLDPSGLTVEAEVPVDGRPAGIAVGAGSVWVTDAVEGTVLRIDPEEHHVVDRIEVQDPGAVAVGGGSVWVANTQRGTVAEIDPASGRVVNTARVGNGPIGIATTAGAVWVVNQLDATLSRISTSTGRVVSTVPLQQSPSGIAAGLRSVWVTSEEAGLLLRVDPTTNAITQTIQVGNGPVGVAVEPSAVWVANPPDGTVSRVDPVSARVTKVTVEGAPSQLAFANRVLWSGNRTNGTLAQIDPERQRVIKVVNVESEPAALAAAEGGLWVAALAPHGSHRGGTLRAASSGGDQFDSIDPGVSYRGQAWQALSMVYDGLVTFRRAAGPPGTTIVPDLATALPVVQSGGLTYTFQLRTGIRYSNGRRLEPRDVRSSLERQFRGGTGLAAFGPPLVGVDECSRRRCDLSDAITVDDASRTVTFHLTEPHPDFLFELALPFGSVTPAGAADGDVDRHPLPGTGPYRIERYVPNRRLVLGRNPRFREWSADAQPAGIPDRIVYALNVDPAQATTDVERGRTDVMLEPPPEGRLDEISRTFPTRAHPFVLPVTYYAFLNTRRPPFDDVRVRRAVNYALDRQAVVRLWGSRAVARLTCQVLPPGLQGYAPYCPYTAGNAGSEIWRAPDVARARRLVAQAGAQGTPVTVAVSDDPAAKYPDARLATARYLVQVLDRLGLRADLRVYRVYQTFYEQAGRPSASIESGIQGWETNFQRASDFFLNLLTCDSYQPAAQVNLNAAGFCSPRVDRAVRRAYRLDPTDPGAASRLWARSDRTVVDEAPWVALVNTAGLDLVSERVGNYQRSPQYGVLLDQLWVR